jgi:hypothetical protein
VGEEGLLLFSCRSSFRRELAKCCHILLVSSFLGARVAPLELLMLTGFVKRKGLVYLLSLNVAAGVFVAPLLDDNCVDFLVS